VVTGSFVNRMIGQETISSNMTSSVTSSVDQHSQLSAADIVSMLHGLSAEQQNEFYHAIGLEHKQQFYDMLGLCPSTNDSLHSQQVAYAYNNKPTRIFQRNLVIALRSNLLESKWTKFYSDSLGSDISFVFA